MRIRLEIRAIAVLYLCFCHDAHSCFLMLDIVLTSVSPPQKYHPLFIKSLSPLNLQTAQAPPLLQNSPCPLYWFCVRPHSPPSRSKNRIFQWTCIIPIVYKMFLSLNISDFSLFFYVKTARLNQS